MITAILTSVTLLLPLYGLAQQGYLVTDKNDTIYGAVNHNFAWFGNRITVRNDSGKHTFHYNDIKAYRQFGKKYMKAKALTKKGKELTWHCRVVVEGTLTLLAETVMDGPAHFLYYKGDFYELDRKHFPIELWEKLVQCHPFAEKYADGYSATGGRLLNFPWQLKKWAAMVEYYNSQCAAKEKEKQPAPDIIRSR